MSFLFGVVIGFCLLLIVGAFLVVTVLSVIFAIFNALNGGSKDEDV